MRHVRHLALFLGVIAVPARAQPLPEDPGLQCRRAIAMAEREYRLPAGLLPAIARVESVRPDPVTGAPTPWPWTINAEGAADSSTPRRRRWRRSRRCGRAECG
ncbi:hypothetical protein ACFQU2_15870 [Siccirubricoccus deserti]